jgi:hypothetical protein
VTVKILGFLKGVRSSVEVGGVMGKMNQAPAGFPQKWFPPASTFVDGLFCLA